MLVTAGVSDTMIACGDNLGWKIRHTKVKRYWPGKALECVDDVDDDGDIRMGSAIAAPEKAFSHNEEILDVATNDDPRLRRLSKLDYLEERRADRRRIRQAENVPIEEGVNKRQEDEDAFEGRKRINERLVQREQEEATLMPEEMEEEDEEETEYEIDSEEEQTIISMAFVPKAERYTIAECKQLEAKERALEEFTKRRLKERKVETRQILVEEIRKSEQIHRNKELEANITDVDTDEDNDKVNEEEKGKAREVERINRDREAREAKIKEKEEIEKLRKMTEEERREWDRKNLKLAPPLKRKRRFMQKYYHKGAFFQDDLVKAHNIYCRDFSALTREDKMDKTILPKVMQVKHFGLKGRTKWTDLANEDTTDLNSPRIFNDPLNCWTKCSYSETQRKQTVEGH